MSMASSSSSTSDRHLYVLGGAVGALVLREAFSYWKNSGIDTTTPSTTAHTDTDKDIDTDTDIGTVSLLGTAHPFVNLKDLYEECVYMDYNATTPVWPEVTAVMKVSLISQIRKESTLYYHPILLENCDITRLTLTDFDLLDLL